jgi:hypothetical protein
LLLKSCRGQTALAHVVGQFVSEVGARCELVRSAKLACIPEPAPPRQFRLKISNSECRMVDVSLGCYGGGRVLRVGRKEITAENVVNSGIIIDFVDARHDPGVTQPELVVVVLVPASPHDRLLIATSKSPATRRLTLILRRVICKDGVSS